MYPNFITQEFESSSQTTPQLKSFYTQINNYIKKELKDIAKDVKINKGHFFVSFFITRNDGEIFYILMQDLRDNNWYENILYRTAKDYKDTSGGRNNYCKLANLKDRLESF